MFPPTGHWPISKLYTSTLSLYILSLDHFSFYTMEIDDDSTALRENFPLVMPFTVSLGGAIVQQLYIMTSTHQDDHPRTYLAFWGQMCELRERCQCNGGRWQGLGHLLVRLMVFSALLRPDPWICHLQLLMNCSWFCSTLYLLVWQIPAHEGNSGFGHLMSQRQEHFL